MVVNKNAIYFPGLNSLRFFAALIVILHHVEFVKNKLGLPNHMDIVFFQKGNLGVTLFFVLSGFLITYLLLVEENTNGKISVKKFYLRRILRIWPLYFLIIAAVFFFLIFNGHFSDYWRSLSFYLLILPNLAFVLYSPIEGVYHLWTIGIEEQFYLLWPLKLKYLKNHFLKVLVFIILFFPLLRIVLFYFYKYFPSTGAYAKFAHFVLTLQFESMAVGAVLAYILFLNLQSFLKILFSLSVQIIIYIIIAYIMFYDLPDFYLNSIFVSALFGVLILNVAANKKSLINIENRYFSYLGKISYGLYIYHLIIIYIVISFFPSSGKHGWNHLENSILHIIVIILTIGISSISYHFFESKVLGLKDKIA